MPTSKQGRALDEAAKARRNAFEHELELACKAIQLNASEIEVLLRERAILQRKIARYIERGYDFTHLQFDKERIDNQLQDLGYNSQPRATARFDFTDIELEQLEAICGIAERELQDMVQGAALHAAAANFRVLFSQIKAKIRNAR